LFAQPERGVVELLLNNQSLAVRSFVRSWIGDREKVKKGNAMDRQEKKVRWIEEKGDVMDRRETKPKTNKKNSLHYSDLPGPAQASRRDQHEVDGVYLYRRVGARAAGVGYGRRLRAPVIYNAKTIKKIHQ